MWSFNLVRYYRKKFCQKYPHRFIQGIDYKEIDHPLYKYEMLRDRKVQTSWLGSKIVSIFFLLDVLGYLTIKEGYRWDGPSGPTIDTASFMRSSAVHDCFFQALRMALIEDELRENFFLVANDDLERISVEDGMLKTRAAIVRASVSKFGKKHTLKEAA